MDWLMIINVIFVTLCSLIILPLFTFEMLSTFIKDWKRNHKFDKEIKIHHRVSRVEVISPNGRESIHKGKGIVRVETQDEGQTLKIFI